MKKTNKEELSKLLALGYTIKRMAEELNCSQTNIRYWLNKFNLKPVHGPHGKIPKDLLKPRKCGKCGETDPNKFYGHKKSICSKCHKTYTLEQGHKKRKKALDLLGNKCLVCGYSKYSCSLDIHHIDPTKKDPGFSHHRSWAWNRLEEELKNCVLLCRNCHAATHNGEINLSKYIH